MTTYYRIRSEKGKYIKCTNTSYILVGYEKSLVMTEEEAAEKLCKGLNEEGTHGYLFVEPDTRPPLKDATEQGDPWSADNKLLAALAAIEHDGHASCYNCNKHMEEPDHVCECGAYICFCCFEKGSCPDCGDALI